ncbi:MAG: inorganic diphosphatase [Fibrobacterota bacterium]
MAVFFILFLIFSILTPAGAENVSALIEIPSGTSAKWELNKNSGLIEWEIKDGKKRIVNYLPYVCNYGMIPGTLLRKEDGGDGDPLDIIVLGPAMERGDTLGVRVIGIMHMIDGGETDDKIMSVSPSSVFRSVRSVNELRDEYPGVLEILKIWFANYKGRGQISVKGVSGPDIAAEMIRKAKF